MIKIINQIIKFGIVGIICFIIDYSILIFLKEVLNTNILLGNTISFTISTIFNYILSIKWVFDARENRLIVFIIFSIFGLMINQTIMYLGVNIININYIIIKPMATIITMFFNFITRKILLENVKFE